METWIQFVWEIKVCTAIALASSFFSRSFYLFVYLHLETSKKFISQGQIQACTGDPVRGPWYDPYIPSYILVLRPKYVERILYLIYGFVSWSNPRSASAYKHNVETCIKTQHVLKLFSTRIRPVPSLYMRGSCPIKISSIHVLEYISYPIFLHYLALYHISREFWHRSRWSCRYYDILHTLLPDRAFREVLGSLPANNRINIVLIDL